MNKTLLSFIRGAALLLALGLLSGCESTDGGSTQVTSNVYYGVGFYDPWYHGHYDYDYDVVVTPPDRPGTGPHPEHPIARPPGGASRPPSVSPRPAPSIPSAPRAMPRGGGGRRR